LARTTTRIERRRRDSARGPARHVCRWRLRRRAR
jgi:hypothetical protein